jgi:hypothetical protein
VEHQTSIRFLPFPFPFPSTPNTDPTSYHSTFSTSKNHGTKTNTLTTSPKKTNKKSGTVATPSKKATQKKKQPSMYHLI